MTQVKYRYNKDNTRLHVTFEITELPQTVKLTLIERTFLKMHLNRFKTSKAINNFYCTYKIFNVKYLYVPCHLGNEQPRTNYDSCEKDAELSNGPECGPII